MWAEIEGSLEVYRGDKEGRREKSAFADAAGGRWHQQLGMILPHRNKSNVAVTFPHTLFSMQTHIWIVKVFYIVKLRTSKPRQPFESIICAYDHA